MIEDNMFKKILQRIPVAENAKWEEYDSSESLSVFIGNRERSLYEEIKDRKKVYLDTKFWIFLRDVELGISKTQDDIMLYHKLISLSEKKQLICPITDVVFIELLKQTDPVTKMAMARVIDRLCHGTIIKSYFDRLSTEFYHFLLLASQGKEPPPLPAQPYIWSRIPYVMGLFSVETKLEKSIQDKVNKGFFDVISKMHFVELINIISASDIPFPEKDLNSWEDVAKSLNIEKRQVTSSSLNELHSNEIGGIIDVIGGSLGDVAFLAMKKLYADNFPEKIEQKDKEQLIDMAKKIVFNIFKHKKSKMALWLPTFHIIASLNAAINKDTKRNFKPNDFIDFKHASAAMPYCDVFATDIPLATLLKSGALKIEETFGSRAVSTTRELIELLDVMMKPKTMNL